jgi:ribosomal protein S18 acetylase RimI-like enzyme
MPLPILKASSEPTGDDLLRYFHRAQLHWTRHLGEESTLDFGVAFTNPTLNRVHDANRILEASVPLGATADEAVRQVQTFYASRGCTCYQWVPNPSAEPGRVAPLVDHLLTLGHRRQASDVMHLKYLPRGAIAERPDLKIIPARASYRHVQELATEASQRWNEPQLVDATLLHLDDAHWDALLALKDGRAVGMIGVLAVGEIGLVEDVYVAEAHRNQGIGKTLMSRAVEICARSLFKHVLLEVAPDNAAAIALYKKFGFRKVAEAVAYGKADAADAECRMTNQ